MKFNDLIAGKSLSIANLLSLSDKNLAKKMKEHEFKYISCIEDSELGGENLIRCEIGSISYVLALLCKYANLSCEDVYKRQDKEWGLDFGDFNDILVVYEQKEHPENLIAVSYTHLLASAAGAILGSWIGSKLFGNQNFQATRQNSYKNPSAYTRSVDSFNKQKAANSAARSSGGKSGFFGGGSKSSSSSSSFGG